MSGSPGAAASRSLFLISLSGKQTIRHNKSQNRLEERFWDYLYHLFNIYTIYINSLLFGVSPEAEVTRYIFPLKHPLRHVTVTLSGLKLCSQIKDFGTKTHFF